MEIQYHNRNPLPESKAAGAKYVSFDTLLSRSDVISLNLSLNASTRHIIGAKELARMKDGVIIINTARGALIDEAALVEALDSGKVFSAGLDVYEEEPKVHKGLLENSNVVLLPHIGTATYETQVSSRLLAVLLCPRNAVMTGEELILFIRLIWNVWSCLISAVHSRKESFLLKYRNNDSQRAVCKRGE